MSNRQQNLYPFFNNQDKELFIDQNTLTNIYRLQNISHLVRTSLWTLERESAFMIAARGPEFSSQQQHMTPWRLTSTATRMFVKKLFQANKVIITIFAKWLAFCMGINRWPMNSHHTGTVMRKTISLHNVILQKSWRLKSLATWLFAQQFGSGVCHNLIKTKSRFVRACTGEQGNASLMVGFPPQRDSDAGKILMYDVIMRAQMKQN